MIANLISFFLSTRLNCRGARYHFF